MKKLYEIKADGIKTEGIFSDEEIKAIKYILKITFLTSEVKIIFKKEVENTPEAISTENKKIYFLWFSDEEVCVNLKMTESKAKAIKYFLKIADLDGCIEFVPVEESAEEI